MSAQRCADCGELLPWKPPSQIKKEGARKRVCSGCMGKRMGLDPVCTWTPEIQNMACNCSRCHVAKNHDGIGLLPGYTNNETKILIALRSAKKANVGGVWYEEIVRLTGVWPSMVIGFCRTSPAVEQRKEGRRVLNSLAAETLFYIDAYFQHLENERAKRFGEGLANIVQEAESGEL